MVGAARFELTTSGPPDRRSSRLSYAPVPPAGIEPAIRPYGRRLRPTRSGWLRPRESNPAGKGYEPEPASPPAPHSVFGRTRTCNASSGETSDVHFTTKTVAPPEGLEPSSSGP